TQNSSALFVACVSARNSCTINPIQFSKIDSISTLKQKLLDENGRSFYTFTKSLSRTFSKLPRLANEA
ncbi:hypothetical protein KAI46_00125, partial [bacterium]|nr:hypothetical protein [bacterium]